MMSGHGTIETAVKATKLGAYDFVEKPLSLEKTLLVVERALEHTRARAGEPAAPRAHRARSRDHRHQPRVVELRAADRHGGADERPRPDLRRERRGQGAGRAVGSRALRAAGPAFVEVNTRPSPTS